MTPRFSLFNHNWKHSFFTIGSYPWVVGLWRKFGSRPFCGGSLIHRQWMLTAAHCVTGQSAGGLKVVLGDHDVTKNVRMIVIKSEAKKMGHFQKLAINKNPQFLSYPHETWWKWLPHEVIILTKFYEDRTKIVDFLLMANYWVCSNFFLQTLFSKILASLWIQGCFE